MRKQGFTLLEILIVVAIIGILARIVLVNLDTARARGRDARRAADMKQMQQAIENYFENNNSYPIGTGGSFLSTTLYPTYLASTPKDPSGTDYCYTGTNTETETGTGSNYCIGAYFEKGVPASLGPSSLCSLSNCSPGPSGSTLFKVGGP